MKNLSEQLKQIRKQLGLTQLQMAKRFGVTMHGYRLWEIGANGMRADKQQILNKLIQEANDK